jgi:hypothetical protein
VHDGCCEGEEEDDLENCPEDEDGIDEGSDYIDDDEDEMLEGEGPYSNY